MTSTLLSSKGSGVLDPAIKVQCGYRFCAIAIILSERSIPKAVILAFLESSFYK